MPKPNYAFAKRQRDLAKKQKKEEKRLRKTPREGDTPDPEGTQPATSEAGADPVPPQS